MNFSFADYVAFEPTSQAKHEYLGGQIYAMVSGTPEHAALAAAVSGLLFGQLRQGPCRVYGSDLRVRAGDLVTYPDVTVVCDPLKTDPADASTMLNPKVVVEVTSRSTEDYDRGEKLLRFQVIESLQVALIVSHRERRVDRFERHAAGWTHDTFVAGHRIELRDLGCAPGVDDIYAAVPSI